jgi:peptidoglycan/LPS O-acetylase OafA/YrhL
VSDSTAPTTLGALELERARPEATPHRGLPYLPALDGLRAVAVAAVILFHADAAGFAGGFFGVEVFFVISGYLIASLLFAEWTATGRISLPRFWFRRARRLLPGLGLLLLGAMAIASTVAKDTLSETRGDLPAAILFFTNWWHVLQNHSYFMAVERPPLLGHLWSLAVEEQFYLFVPPLFVLLLGLVRRVPRAAIGGAAAAIGVASACWMARLFDPSADPGAIYERTDTRLSGLLLGVALAAAWPPRTGASAGAHSAPPARAAPAALEVLAVVGLGALFWAFSCLRATDAAVYRGGFLLVDVATMAVIAACARGTSVAAVVGSAPFRWVGLRSYALYLWHVPIFAVTRPELDVAWTGGKALVLRLALTAIAAEMSYRFVELPARGASLETLARLLRGHASPPERARLGRLGFGALAVFGVALALPVHAAGTSPAPTATAVGATPAPAASALAPAPAEAQAPDPAQAATGEGAAGPFSAPGIPLDPAWPKTLTVLTDSVTLGAKWALPAAMPGWQVEFVGRPALMVKQVVPEFLKDRAHVGSVVVVGLAYNSLFEKNRRNYDRWAAQWDREAERLVADLRARGAKKIVWVTLREPSPEVITDQGRKQYDLYAWFFPYVNERLRALAQRHPEIALADWTAVSDKLGLTVDLIHLNTAGAKLMSHVISDAVLGPS